MGKLKANSFRGYTSKPGLINVPGLGRDCFEVIINRGDLCSFPKFKSQRKLIENKLMDAFFHSQFGNEDLIIWKDGEGMFQLVDPDPSTPIDPISSVNTFLDNPLYFNKNTINSAAGNWLQVGDWLLYLGLFRPVQGAIGKKPRMVRIHKRIIGNTGLFKEANYIGIAPPRRARVGVTIPFTGILTAPDGLDFAFTFVTNDKLIGTETNDLDNDNAESVAVKLIQPMSGPVGDNSFSFFVYLPEGAATMEPTGSANSGIRVGMYMRKLGSEADYSFVKYSVSNLPIHTSNVGPYPGEPFVIVTLGQSQGNFPTDDTPGTNMDDIVNTEKKAVFTGRVVPPPSRHAIVFKKRVYYAPVPPSQNDPKPFWALNHLQYSEQLIAGNGIEANYIENFQIIGDEASGITGLVEFLGQLIIFKQKETWLLSDDILSGSIIKLFHNLGCVNRFGGHGYLVVGSVLYFVDASGVYAWDGQTKPVKISEAIKEDLDKIPRNVSDRTIDRYGYARLSHDPQYNLIYLTFPKYDENQEALPTFIYHIDEKGAWTKTAGFFVLPNEEYRSRQVSRILTAQSGNRYLLTSRRFMKMGKLDDPEGVSGVLSTWWSSVFDANAPARKKHWKFINIAASSISAYGLAVAFDVEELTGNNLVVGDGNKRVKIGRHTSIFAFSLVSGTGQDPFRIHGYEIDVHLRGRR